MLRRTHAHHRLSMQVEIATLSLWCWRTQTSSQLFIRNHRKDDIVLWATLKEFLMDTIGSNGESLAINTWSVTPFKPKDLYLSAWIARKFITVSIASIGIGWTTRSVHPEPRWVIRLVKLSISLTLSGTFFSFLSFWGGSHAPQNEKIYYKCAAHFQAHWWLDRPDYSSKLYYK